MYLNHISGVKPEKKNPLGISWDNGFGVIPPNKRKDGKVFN